MLIVTTGSSWCTEVCTYGWNTPKENQTRSTRTNMQVHKHVRKTWQKYTAIENENKQCKEHNRNTSIATSWRTKQTSKFKNWNKLSDAKKMTKAINRTTSNWHPCFQERWDDKTPTETYQRHKEVIKYEIYCYKRSHVLASFPHGQVHDLIPTFLGQYLEHGHRCLVTRSEKQRKREVRKRGIERT